MAFALSSTAFDHQGEIPRKFTCEGEDVSPPLHWSGVPSGTRSFALIVEDPDAPDPKAPRLIWTHWVLYNIPADTTTLAEDEKRHGVPPGVLQGINGWTRTGYGGPCPPVGRHRYFHRLYALDVALPNLDRPDRKALRAAMKGHVLGEAELVGTYEKTGG